MKNIKPAPEAETFTPAEIYCRYCRRLATFAREEITENEITGDDLRQIYMKAEIFDMLAEHTNIDPVQVSGWLSDDAGQTKAALIDLSFLREVCFPETAAQPETMTPAR